MPYRIDLPETSPDTLTRLVDLGALDIESSADGEVAALFPDAIPPEQLARVLGVEALSISQVTGRDAGSVWVLSPRSIRIGRLEIVPAHLDAAPGALRLIDGAAFGTGLHPSTALCLEAMEEVVPRLQPECLLDVGTGSGILALGGLRLGVPRADAIDVDEHAVAIAEENARLNGLNSRLRLVHGTPGSLREQWPLVVANILAAPLIELAPSIVRCVGTRGVLVLSGISSSLEEDVSVVYRSLGMRQIDVKRRLGWAALVLEAGW